MELGSYVFRNFPGVLSVFDVCGCYLVGQVATFSRCVFSIFLLCQAVNFLLIVVNYFVGLSLSPLNGEICEFSDVIV